MCWLVQQSACRFSVDRNLGFGRPGTRLELDKIYCRFSVDRNLGFGRPETFEELGESVCRFSVDRNLSVRSTVYTLAQARKVTADFRSTGTQISVDRLRYSYEIGRPVQLFGRPIDPVFAHDLYFSPRFSMQLILVLASYIKAISSLLIRGLIPIIHFVFLRERKEIASL